METSESVNDSFAQNYYFLKECQINSQLTPDKISLHFILPHRLSSTTDDIIA